MTNGYKTFNVLYSAIDTNKGKIVSTQFYATNENLADYGIELFYLDVQKILEQRHKILCFLKVGALILIPDRTNFVGIPKGKAIKTTKFIRDKKEFYRRAEYNEFDTKILG